MQEITTQNDFDYSLVDFETQEFLQVLRKGVTKWKSK